MKITTKNYIIRAIFLILVIAWMATVFMFSSQPANDSDKTSSRVTRNIIEIFARNKTEFEKEELIEKFDPVVRKFAHYSIFLIGGFLIYNFVNTYSISEKNKIIYTILVGVLYACTDEIHQMFVKGRAGQIQDVCIDSFGVATGICIFLCIKNSFKSIKNKLKNKT